MTMMPRGTPRSVLDPVGQAYEEMLRLWNANGHSWNEAGERPRPTEAPRAKTRAAPSSDSTGYYQLGREWLTGQGPRHHEFGPDDPATQILRQHEHIQRVRDRIATSGPKLGPVDNAGYSLAGFGGVPDFAKDYSAVLTGGRTGNLAAAYLGSYGLEPVVREVKNGVATVDFAADNRSTLASAVHLPIVGYAKRSQEPIDAAVNRLRRSGPLSPTRQSFRWTEQIPMKSGRRR